jgi:molybdate transport system substrate-binding protein
VKLVLAATAVPAGRYARMALANIARRNESPPGYADRVLANVVSNEETVKGVVTKVQLGEADAGIVYASDITPELRVAVRALEIPAESNITALYPIAVLRQAGAVSLAREFLDLVLSPTGQGVLQANGFLSALP